MKKQLFLFFVFIAFTQTAISQVVPDSLIGIYSGSYYWKYSDVNTWTFIQFRSEIVSNMDTANCLVQLDGPGSELNGHGLSTFWTDYSFCNGVYNPDPWYITCELYPKFYSTDSIRTFWVIPRPFPYTNRYHYRFLGKRIPGTSTVGMKELINSKYFNIYPNPGNGMVTIENSGNFNSYELFDINSNRLASDSVDPKSFPLKLDFSFLNPGIYMIRLIGDNTIQTGKIVIQ